MTNDELKTAAERWGRKGIRSATYPEEETMYEIPRQRLLDAEHLADAYLARLAADEQREREDAEPIDFGDRVERGCTKDIFISLWKESKVVAIVQHEETVDGPEVSCVTTKIKTRGQLRKLLEALKGGGQ